MEGNENDNRWRQMDRRKRTICMKDKFCIILSRHGDGVDTIEIDDWKYFSLECEHAGIKT